MFICLRVKRETECRLNQRGQRGPRAESRACYVLARSLCFHCHRLSSTSSAPSSNVFLPARYDDSSSVDFSHSRPLFPCFICPPPFCQHCWRTHWKAAPWLSPHIHRVTDVLTHTKGCSPGLDASQVPPLFCRSPGGFRFRPDRFSHFLGKTIRLPWDLRLQD